MPEFLKHSRGALLIVVNAGGAAGGLDHRGVGALTIGLSAALAASAGESAMSILLWCRCRCD